MAVNFLKNQEVSDVCLGKPPLKRLPIKATISEALSALKRSGETHLSVWSCCDDLRSSSKIECVGKICMVDVICLLCKEENLADPSKALEGSLSDILLKAPRFSVRNLESDSSLLQALDYFLDGTQNLVIPIESYAIRNSRKKFLNKPASFSSTHHNGREFCWITQEHVVRFLLNSIGIFSPFSTYTIESLNIIDRNIMTISCKEPASSALPLIYRSLVEQTSVAVIDENNKLIGEISPSTLAFCDETVAAAIATLSAGDLLAYIDCCGPPEELVQLVKMRLEEKNLEAMLDLLEEYSLSSSSSSSASSSCSSDDESLSSKFSGSSKYSSARRSEAIVCYPRSSLVAVMVQALAYRVSCVWVVEDDYTLVGIVTFKGMLEVFRNIAVVQCKVESKSSALQ